MSNFRFEAGNHYRTRDGRKAVVLLIRPGYMVGEIEGQQADPTTWTLGGCFFSEPIPCALDLVAEWREPARVRVTLWRNRQPAPCGRMYEVTLTDVIIPGCQWEVLDTFELVEGEGLKS